MTTPDALREPIYDIISAACREANDSVRPWEPIDRAADAILALTTTPLAVEVDLTERVRRLVIAARHVAYTSAPDGRGASEELDQATEAFAADIPWENGDDA